MDLIDELRACLLKCANLIPGTKEAEEARKLLLRTSNEHKGDKK